MAFKNQHYIIGGGTIPEWLREQANLGRAKFNYEDGELISVTVFGVPKTKVAKLGDSIVLSKSGLGVIPKQTIGNENQKKAVK